MTDYILLRQDPEDQPDFPEAWYTLDGIHKASSAKRALDGADLTIPGNYVAVPLRSWKPLPVKIDQKTVVTVG